MHWTERSSFLVERDTMVSAYAVRRLLESWKVSDELSAERIRVRQYPLLHYPPDLLNRYFYRELFDLSSPAEVTLSPRDLCNQIIHSWIWSLSATENYEEFNGIYVSSDKKRTSLLYFLHIDQLVELFRRVGAEDVTYKHFVRDKDGGRYIRIVADE